MATTTATVETLTAEVRVMKVGSRQITSGVYDQLDVVAYGDITPFGRVRPKWAEGANIYVVGATSAGELCRSTVSKPNRTYKPTPQCLHWLYHALVSRVGSISVNKVDSTFTPRENYPICFTLSGHTPPDCYSDPHEWPPRPGGGLSSLAKDDWDIYMWLNCEHAHRWKAGDFCGFDQLAADANTHFDEAIDHFDTAQRHYAAAQELPLIVLAGLR